MSTLPPPVKFKAYLGRLKEGVIDLESPDINELYRSLLAAELVQRGVLADYDDTDNNKLMDQVIFTAGRPLVNESLLPKPLIAASAAMAGMIAEKCATFTNGANVRSIADPSLMESVRSRCADVKDTRLGTLLDILSAPHETESLRLLFLYVSEGCFLRAASFQPEQPQMWKRSLDAIVLRQASTTTEPWESSIPLSHLLSIAEAKKNSKRVSELSLRLVESWLSPRETLESKLQETCVQAFTIPYRPNDRYSNAECIQQAQIVLSKIELDRINDDADNLSWYKLLRFRVECMSEQTATATLAEEKMIASNNRGSSLPQQECYQMARSEILIDSMQNSSALNERAIELRDLVLSLDWTTTDLRVASALAYLQQQSDRLVDRARVVSLDITAKKKSSCTPQDVSMAWSDIMTFAKPVVTGIVSNWDSTTPSEERTESVYHTVTSLSDEAYGLTQSALIAISCWAWMVCNRDGNDSYDVLLLALVSDALSSCLRVEQERERQSKDESVVKSSINAEQNGLSELECAHATVFSLVGLADVGETDNRMSVQQATKIAVAMTDKDEEYRAQEAKFGTSYLVALLAWSGLHRNPWPFCKVTQARAINRQARSTLKSAFTEWGRPRTELESLLLDISDADTESGSLNGGNEEKAEALYKDIFKRIESNIDGIDPSALSLLRAHCLNGLASLALHGKSAGGSSRVEVAGVLAEKALNEAASARMHESTPLFLWKSNVASRSSALFLTNVSRQLVADSLLQSSRSSDAQSFLEDAVRDNPSDFGAAFALGAFRLRTALYETPTTSPEAEKAAQTQLLKSAKLDSEQADPFALLGIWYEDRNDMKRALGCYSKALLLNPSNPVAGRGVLRLKSSAEVQGLCEVATDSNEPTNGWAWRAIGQHKAMVESDEELAILCFLKALRCRDIDCRPNESLSIFFAPPARHVTSSTSSELTCVWSELAECYRRMGRYAAAERAFHAASQAVGDKMSSQLLCSWAQVELELGLFEEAIEKFGLVLDRGNDTLHAMAAFGQGSGLLALAQRDAVDGKAGAAFAHVKRAIGCLEETFTADSKSMSKVGCAQKLLGDLYSFGALLPPDVFVNQKTEDDYGSMFKRSQGLLRAQAAFVSRGAEAYRIAANTDIGRTEKEASAHRAAILCDLGGNILLEGQILSSAFGEAQGCTPELSLKDVMWDSTEVKKAYQRSADAFKSAIKLSPLCASAWCGLGCALSATDPLLAQHAFCTSLHLDKTLPDSYSNLAFLFAGNEVRGPSAEMLDALTQVADSPLMWICRAFLLETDAIKGLGPSNANLSRAADAYRAASHVVKHPAALIGLSLTGRVTSGTNQQRITYSEMSGSQSRRDCFGYMSEYLGLSSSCNLGLVVLEGVMATEDGVEKAENHPCLAWPLSTVTRVRDVIANASKGLSEYRHDDAGASADKKGLDVYAIRQLSEIAIDLDRTSDLVALSKETMLDDSKPSAPFEHDVSPGRQIIHDPENGKAWLDLAKSLAMELPAISDCKKRKLVKELLEAASRAGDRAAQVFSHQLSCPLMLKPAQHVSASALDSDSSGESLDVSASGVVPVPVAARDASEALALAYWLEMVVEMEILHESDEARAPTRAMDLQRAIIMDPESHFARQALRSGLT